MALTSKQEKFCIEVVSGKDLSEAYRIAYDAEKMSSESINVNASKLYKNAKIALRIEELRKPEANKAQITLQGQILRLQKLVEKAEDSEKYNDAINALKEQNKLLGLYEEHNRQKNPMSDEEKEKRIEALLSKLNAK